MGASHPVVRRFAGTEPLVSTPTARSISVSCFASLVVSPRPPSRLAGTLVWRYWERREKRREPAVFRARRAHARSRGPRAENAVGQREACRGRGRTGIVFERRAVERQSEFPCPPAIWMSPEQHQPMKAATAPELGGAVIQMSVPEIDGPMRSWPPGRRDQLRSLLAHWYYVKGVRASYVRPGNRCIRIDTRDVSEATVGGCRHSRRRKEARFPAGPPCGVVNGVRRSTDPQC
jgi:hypothetical protein